MQVSCLLVMKLNLLEIMMLIFLTVTAYLKTKNYSLEIFIYQNTKTLDIQIMTVLETGNYY